MSIVDLLPGLALVTLAAIAVFAILSRRSTHKRKQMRAEKSTLASDAPDHRAQRENR